MPQKYDENSNAVRGVEIFAPGTHNGDQYSEQDLDDIVDSFAKLDFRPALKIGHTKDKPGAPAYGWVTNLRKAGGKLVADFESMHDSVVQALRDKRYDRVSSEIYFNLKRGDGTFRRALKAVALLGADVPAVAGLTPLHKMEFAESGFESLAACEQELDASEAAEHALLGREVADLETAVKVLGYPEYNPSQPRGPKGSASGGEWISGGGSEGGGGSGSGKGDSSKPETWGKRFLSIMPKGARFAFTDDPKTVYAALGTVRVRDGYVDMMVSIVGPDGKPSRAAERISVRDQQVFAKKFDQQENDEMTIKELREKKLALETQLAELSKKGDKMTDEDKAAMKKCQEDVKAFGDQITQLEKAETDAKELAELRAARAADQERLAALEAKDRAREVSDRVQKCTVPAFRPLAEALYSYALAHGETKVKYFAAADKDGKRTESEKSLPELIDGMIETVNASAKHLFSVVSKPGPDGKRPEGPASDDPGAEVDRLASQRLRDKKSANYEEAMDAVLAEHPELAKQYSEQQAGANA